MHTARIHANEREFPCDECPLRFNISTELVHHKKIVHLHRRDFHCTYPGCSSQFSSKSNLEVHLKFHNNERSHICEECDKSFVTAQGLKDHTRIHTGERPYICDYDGCMKSYMQSGRLQIHGRTHTNDRPFVCNYIGCGIRFIEGSHLAAHEQIHLPFEHRKWKCVEEGCSFSATQGHVLKQHFTAVHTEEGIQRRKKKEEHFRKWIEEHSLPYIANRSVNFRHQEGGESCVYLDFFIVRPSDGTRFVVELGKPNLFTNSTPTLIY